MSAGQARETVPVSDRGLNYGDGLFETMRAAHGGIPLLAAHLERLGQGLLRLGIPVPDPAVVDAAVAGALSRVPGEGGVVKLLVTRGDGGRGYAPPQGGDPRLIVTTHPLPVVDPAIQRAGARVGRCSTPLGSSPATAGLKHIGRLEQVLGAREVQAAEWDEGLMCDESGAVIEGTRTNLFLVTGEGLHTPDLTRAGVAGVLRARCLEWLRNRGFPVTVRRVDYDELHAADEVFLANSVLGLWPVGRLDTRTWTMWPRCRELAAGLGQEGLTWVG